MFDYRFASAGSRQIEFNYLHIYDNLIGSNDCEGSRLEDKKLRGWIEDNYRCEYVVDPNGGQRRKASARFREFINDAWSFTRKYLQKSYREAIPTFYKGKIQLLVPLFLGECARKDERPSAALVVTLYSKEDSDSVAKPHYFCPTVLSLEMARRDSRVITRVDKTWLNPYAGGECIDG